MKKLLLILIALPIAILICKNQSIKAQMAMEDSLLRVLEELT